MVVAGERPGSQAPNPKAETVGRSLPQTGKVGRWAQGGLGVCGKRQEEMRLNTPQPDRTFSSHIKRGLGWAGFTGSRLPQVRCAEQRGCPRGGVILERLS